MDTLEVNVIQAAVEWWSSKQPITWSYGYHLKYPMINTVTDSEISLAKAVGALLVNQNPELVEDSNTPTK